jgi:hypothetical protein
MTNETVEHIVNIHNETYGGNKWKYIQKNK